MRGRLAWPLLALAPLLAVPAIAAPAAPPPAQPVSLIVAGRWLDVTVIVQPACPADIPGGEQCLSLNVIADVALGDVRTLAGPDVPPLLTARFEFHAPPAKDYHQVLLARPSAVHRGQFEAVSVGRMHRKHEACFDRSLLARHDVRLPAQARIAGGRVCFRQAFAAS